jgi:hypothetical protein
VRQLVFIKRRHLVAANLEASRLIGYRPPSPLCQLQSPHSKRYFISSNSCIFQLISILIAAIARERIHTPFENLSHITSYRPPVSLDKAVFGTLSLSAPHLGTIIIDTAGLDDRLLWAEVCWVTSLITGRTARVIQAHYEKGKFII